MPEIAISKDVSNAVCEEQSRESPVHVILKKNPPKDDLDSYWEVLVKFWSRGWELNPRPDDYESSALPLSYLGPAGA